MPAQIFREPQQHDLPIIIGLPMALLFSWAYYIQLDALLNTPEMVIPFSLKELATGTGALIERNSDGSWSGRLVTLIALPLFTLLPICFSMVWGWSVIVLWHKLIVQLPARIWSRYASVSAIPSLLVLSFGLTSLALTVGKFTSPEAPMPTSTRVFLINPVFDAASIGVAWYFLGNALTPPGSKDRALRRFLSAVGRLSAVVIATAIFAVLSLYLSLYGTINAVPLRVAMNTLIARPTSEAGIFSARLVETSTKTVADFLIEEDLKAMEVEPFDYNQVLVDGGMIARETGYFLLLDELERKAGHRFTNEFRQLFNAFKRSATIAFYGRSGYGPYFWFMHTTMFPILVIVATMLIYAFSLSINLFAAGWVKRVSRSEKPYNYIAVCAALCGTFCGALAYICK